LDPLFLWPMILPILFLFFYCVIYKKERMREALAILVAIAVMIVLYPPLMDLLATDILGLGYSAVKLILLVLLPIVCLLLFTRDRSFLSLKKYGVKKEGIKKSTLLFLILLPVMLIVTLIQSLSLEGGGSPLFAYGSVMFFEAFTEEFLCRGVLLVFLMSIVDIRIAYFISVMTFVLAHPQYYLPLTLPIIGVLVQAILTAEISRRSGNIIGAWLLHGTNRFFSLVILPFVV